MRNTILLTIIVILFSPIASAQVKSQPAPEGAEVYFITPKDGDVIEGDVVVKFGLKGLGVAPAGTKNEKTGHHHLLINMEKLPPVDQSMPATDNIKHFGGGQTETTISLPKGKHTLQLLVGDYLHVPHNPQIASEKITITVK